MVMGGGVEQLLCLLEIHYCNFVSDNIPAISVDIGWQTIRFKFDGLWKGFGEIADKIMNQLGVGGLIVEKQKR